MTLTIDREERDRLHSLMAYRFCRRRPSAAAGSAQSVTRFSSARKFYEDMQLMADLGWLPPRADGSAAGLPEAAWTEFELTLPADDLRRALERARVDAQHGFARMAASRSPTKPRRAAASAFGSPSRPATRSGPSRQPKGGIEHERRTGPTRNHPEPRTRRAPPAAPRTATALGQKRTHPEDNGEATAARGRRADGRFGSGRSSTGGRAAGAAPLRECQAGRRAFGSQPLQGEEGVGAGDERVWWWKPR